MDSIEMLSKVVFILGIIKGKGFEFDVFVEFIVEVGELLIMILVIENIGDVFFFFNCVLYIYFDVENIKDVEFKGLYGEYKDKLLDWEILNILIVYIIEGEVDRIYFEVIFSVVIECD